jgi:hypothetical protein
VAKIFSRDEYLQATAKENGRTSLRGMTVEEPREAMCASIGKRLTAEHKAAGYCRSSCGDEPSSRRRKGYRHIEAYAGQFY